MKAHPLLKYGAIVFGLPLVFFFWYLLTENLRTLPQPEDYLPSDTVALVYWEDFAATFGGFSHSPLGEKLFGDALEQTAELFNIPTNVSQSITRVVDQIQAAEEHPLFSSLLRNNSYFALLPSEHQAENIQRYITGNGVLLIGLKMPFDQQKVIQRLVRSTLQSHTEYYQGREIGRIKLVGGKVFHYTIMERTLMIGLETRPIERCIDAMNNRLLRSDHDLLHTRVYAKITDQSERHHDFFAYINQNRLVKDLKGFISASSGTPWPEKPGYLYFKSNTNRDTTTITLSLHEPGEGLSTLLGTYFNQQPVRNNYQDILTQDVAVYFWTNWLDYEHLWNTLSISPSLETAAMLFLVGQKVYESTGVDVATFTSMLGQQAGMYIREVQTVGDHRLPLICLQIQLRKPDSMKSFLAERFSDIPTRKVVVGDYDGIAVLLGGGLIQPAFMVYDDRLLIADSVEMLETYLVEPERKLIDAKSYRKVKGSLKNPNNLVAYARIDKINGVLKKLLMLGLDSLQNTGKLNSSQRNHLESDYVQPFFESLNRVHSQGIRVVNHRDWIGVETTLYTPRK